MDKWDGQIFINSLQLNKNKNVLEIGVGTGRLALKVIPNCKHFTGIDFSPKTIERAIENLERFDNKTLICGDFFDYCSTKKFDIIYSSLVLWHIKEKQAFIDKVASLLSKTGVLFFQLQMISLRNLTSLYVKYICIPILLKIQ